MFWKYFSAGFIGYVLGGMTVIEILFRIETRKEIKHGKDN